MKFDFCQEQSYSKGNIYMSPEFKKITKRLLIYLKKWNWVSYPSENNSGNNKSYIFAFHFCFTGDNYESCFTADQTSKKYEFHLASTTNVNIIKFNVPRCASCSRDFKTSTIPRTTYFITQNQINVISCWFKDEWINVQKGLQYFKLSPSPGNKQGCRPTIKHFWILFIWLTDVSVS